MGLRATFENQLLSDPAAHLSLMTVKQMFFFGLFHL